MSSALRVTEGIHGTWFYHLTNDKDSESLCGERTMHSGMPLSSWGYRGHLNERYCLDCETLAGVEHTPYSRSLKA